MATIKFSAVIIQSALRYEADLGDDVTIGSIAQYLVQQKVAALTNTLEIARPIRLSQRLQDVELQAGDRLIMFAHPATLSEFPTTLYSGNKHVKLSLGDFEVSSRGRTTLLVGKPDEARGLQPDIDLSDFIPAQSLPYISRECLQLFFDESENTWYAQKMGQTRLVIDEFELGESQIILEGEKWLYFYRASDDPRSPASHPVGWLRLQVEEALISGNTIVFRAGNCHVDLCVGEERESQTLNASHNLLVERIVNELARYQQTTLISACLMRLVSPSVKLGALQLAPNEFLYAPRSVIRS